MSSTGNARSASVFIISRPTAPVAPTTAILYPIGFYLCAFRFLCLTDQAAAACCGSAGSAPLAAPVHGCCEIPLVRPLTRKRSEEHTSELQSLMRISYAVFCLKKKQQQ